MNTNNIDKFIRDIKNSKDTYQSLNALTSLRQEIEKLIIEESKKLKQRENNELPIRTNQKTCFRTT